MFDDPVTLRAPGAGGRIVIDAQLAGADGASITLDGFDPTVLGASIVTAGGSIDIGGSVVIGSDVALDTTDGGAAEGADILIGGTIEGSGDGTEDLTLSAGSGDISVGGAVGGAARLGALTIASGDAVAFQSTVSAVSSRSPAAPRPVLQGASISRAAPEPGRAAATSHSAAASSRAPARTSSIPDG